MPGWFSFLVGCLTKSATAKRPPISPRRRRSTIECLERRRTLSAASTLVEAPVFVGSEFQVDSTPPGSGDARTSPAIAHADNGDAIVVWQASRYPDYEIHGQRYSAAGTPLGGEFVVNDPGSGWRFGPRIVGDTAGNFVVIWHDSTKRGLYARRFNADGTPAGGEFLISGVWPWNPDYDVAMDDSGNFAVTWREEGGANPGFEARVQLFDAAGGPRGPDFAVSAVAGVRVYGPQVAMDADGDFVLVYTDLPGNGMYHIRAQRFDAAGARQGPVWEVVSDAYLGGIAMAPNGDFVITWTDPNHQGQPYQDVYAARYNAAGVPQGSPFLVNETTSDHQSNPSVSLDGDGDFVIAWSSTHAVPDGFNHPTEVFARRFTAGGRAVTAEFQVHLDQPVHLYSPTVSLDSAGNFLVAWGRDSYPDGHPEQVRAQRFTVADDLTPAVGDDVYSLAEVAVLNVPAAAGLLSNDNDLDGDGVASDFDGDAVPDVSDTDDDNDGTPDTGDNLVGRSDMRAEVVVGPVHGSVTLNADGSFVYVPEADYFGPDSFIYRVVEPNFVVSGLATVSLAVNSVNDAPRIIASHISVPERSGARQLIGWGTLDPGAANEAGQTHTYNIVDVTNPGLFAAAPQLAADGTLSFEIAAGQSGTSTFDVQVTDNGGTANGGQDTQIQTFTIAVGGQLGPLNRSNGDISIEGAAGPDNLEISGDVTTATLFVDGSLGSYTVLDVSGSVSLALNEGGGSLNVHDLYLGGGLFITGSGGGQYDIGVDGIVSTRGDFVLSLADGSNTVNLLNLYIARHINIFTGSGRDDLNLFDPTSANFVLSLSSGGTTVIASGEESDSLNMRYGFIVGDLIVNAGGGDDIFSVYGSAISGTVAVLGGAGADRLTIDTNYFATLFQMFGEADDDVLYLLNCIHAGGASISGDAGEDWMAAQNITAPSLSLAPGADQDLTTVLRSLLGELFAQLGEGDDRVSLYGTTVTGTSLFDGGPGGDFFHTPNFDNSWLGGLSAINFEASS
ncbi:MAG: Ig-like domain-containing protein [Pirellulales bacterium]